MHGKTHPLYLLSVIAFAASLVLSFNFGFRGVSDDNPPPRIILLPFQATSPSPGVASYHLMNGLLWELSKVTDVTVIHPNDVIPSIRKAHDFPSWLRDQDESLVLIGSVSGPEERLTINIIVFDTRALAVDRVLEKTLITNIYNLEHAYETLALNVISLADRHSRN